MDRYELIEPYEHGRLDVGDGQSVHWEQSGHPHGRPVVVLHGGPGGGSTPGMRRAFDPSAYRIVQLDQRGCGDSTPHASERPIDLAVNTTAHLVADVERLRDHLGIERWLVWGGSWGTTLGLAYVQAHPDRVTEVILASVVTTTRAEVEWVTRAMGRVFPAEWARFRDHVPPEQRDGDLSAAYARLLADPDPTVREAAAIEWCRWEDTHVATFPDHQPSQRYLNPHFRMAFATLVTHYWSHAAFLADDELIEGVERLAGIPAVLIHGRLDISGPADIAWWLHQRWSGSELVLLGDAGHGGGSMAAANTAAADRFARR